MAYSRFPWRHRFLLCSLLTLLVVVSYPISTPIAFGQLPTFTTPGTSSPPIGVERRGTLESASVRLDGKELFRIASPAVFNRNELGSQIPVEVRARQIEANLEQLIVPAGALDEAALDPSTLQVVIETVNEQPVLLVQDKTLAEPRVLLTVTDTDAQYYAVSKDRLADRWQAILERELREAVELRRPEALQQQISTALKTSVITALSTLILGAIWTLLGRRKRWLEEQQAIERAALHSSELTSLDASTAEPSEAGEGRWLLQELRHHFGLQQRLQTVQFFRWLLFWSIAFVWVIGIAYSLNTFPQTRQFSRQVVVIPMAVLITWFVTGLVNRLSDFATDRFIQSREQEQSLTAANLQRIATIANVIKGLKMVLLYAISSLWVLQWLNLAPGAILTLGAVLALAISFAAQSLVKDLVNGFLILLEDQFRIGDMIRIGTTAGLAEITGLVENLNLRITQVRSADGNLITLPNNSIAQVENMSRTWARADLQIAVAYNTDVDRALAVIRATVDQMAQDPDWQAWILDTTEVFGVEQLSHTGIMIRVWIKTVPLKQWSVARELRRRLKIAFDHHHIQIGIPQQIWLERGDPTSAAIAPISETNGD